MGGPERPQRGRSGVALVREVGLVGRSVVVPLREVGRVGGYGVAPVIEVGRVGGSGVASIEAGRASWGPRWKVQHWPN